MSEVLVCEQDVTPTAVSNTCKDLDKCMFHNKTTVISPKHGSVYSTRKIEFKNDIYNLSDFRCSGHVVIRIQEEKRLFYSSLIL